MPSPPDSVERFSLQFSLGSGPHQWFFHLRADAISLAIDTFTVYTFDRGGRLFSAFQDGVNSRRSLGGQVLARSGAVGGEQRTRQRRLLSAAEAGRLVDSLHVRLEELDRALRAGDLVVEAGDGRGGPEAMAPWVERLRAWDGAALAADAARFAEVYRPVTILPPDRYMALVLQVTEGCPWNRCAFCDLYRDRPYRVRDAAELDDHLGRVRAFLGEGLRLRRSLFLADGNLLSAPAARLPGLLEQVRAAYPEPRFADLYAFCDVFGTRRLTHADLTGLARAGVRRLYIGLETGCDGLRRQLDKPGAASLVVDAIARLRQAGIQVGVIVLLGPGGREWAAAHEEETAAALEQMPLGPGDFVYYSPLVLPPDMEPARRVASAGRHSLTEVEMAAQRERLEAATTCRERGAHVALYDIRDFAY